MNIDSLIQSEGVYQTTLPTGEVFHWRLLSLKEYKYFSKLREGGLYHPFDIYTQVFKHCYQGEWQALPGHLPIGIIFALGRLCLTLSGDSQYVSLKEDIDNTRANYAADSVMEYMKRVIYIAFSSYTPDDIEQWSYRKLLDTFAVAEALLANKVEGFKPMDTKKIGAKKAESFGLDMNQLAKENRELGDKVGDDTHVLDMHPAELAKRQKMHSNNQRKLSRSQAAALDKRKR